MPHFQSSMWHRAADAAAGDVTPETPLFRAAQLLGLVSVRLTACAAVAGDDTDNAAITLRLRDGQGGAASTLCTLTTNVASGGLSAWIPKLLGPSDPLALSAGSVITVEIEKMGAGVQLPACALALELV